MSFKDAGVAGYNENNKDWFNFNHGCKHFSFLIDGKVIDLSVTGWCKESKSVFIEVTDKSGDSISLTSGGDLIIPQVELRVDDFKAYADDELIGSWFTEISKGDLWY